VTRQDAERAPLFVGHLRHWNSGQAFPLRLLVLGRRGIGADHAAQSHGADGQCREKKFFNRSILEAPRRSIKGGSGEPVAALRATGRRDRRRLRGRMMYATTPAKSAKRTTTTTDTMSVRIYGSAAAAAVISSVFAFQVESSYTATPSSRILASVIGRIG
jgi:hypothetical protein